MSADDNKICSYYGGLIDNVISGDHFTTAYFDDMKKGLRQEIPLEEVVLTKYDTLDGKFHIRVNFSTQYIEIPISLSRINEWKNEIDKQHKLYMEEQKEDSLVE